MRYGISAASIVVDDSRVLLVHHREPGYDFWLPPGGSLEGDESIFDCARRETLEETGLAVIPGQIAYIGEFVEPGYHFVKFFIVATGFSGTPTIDNRPEGEDHLVDARFFSREEMQGLCVYPPRMRGEFWTDLENGFPETLYIGLQHFDG
jgi:8-oxo-dGTP pyrophosphatase MutT (NUDIX family)